MGLRPNQGDEKRPLFSNYSPWKHRPFLCHLDRSAAQWRDLRSAVLSWKCFPTERTRISYFAKPATTTYAALIRESRTQSINATVLDRKSGERSGGTCGFFSSVLKTSLVPRAPPPAPGNPAATCNS